MKYNFASKYSQLVTVTNLFPFEAIQRCQHCQLCELRENLNGLIFSGFYVLMKSEFSLVFLSLLNVNGKFDSLSPHQKQHPFCSNIWSMVNANFQLVHFPCHNDTAS